MKYSGLLAVLLVITIPGCGYIEQLGGSVTGGGFETCVDGVAYLQFTSGVTVKYNRNGTVATCE